jgi:hypothetical protein
VNCSPYLRKKKESGTDDHRWKRRDKAMLSNKASAAVIKRRGGTVTHCVDEEERTGAQWGVKAKGLLPIEGEKALAEIAGRCPLPDRPIRTLSDLDPYWEWLNAGEVPKVVD